MTEFLQLAVLGFATGSLYALSAVGIIVVHRSSGVINFANGAFSMVSGYTMWALAAQAGLPPLAAAAIGILLSIAVAVLVYLVVIRLLANASGLARIVATLAVYIVLQSVVQMIFGPVNKVPTSVLPTGPVDLFGVNVGVDRLIILGLAVGLTIVLWAVYRFTRFGIATTAVAENPRALAALGWRAESVRLGSWAVAGAVGGIAGVLIAPITQLTPSMMLLFLVPSLAAAILGGMRSFPLALVGGVLLGAAQVLASRYIPIPGASDAVPFLVIVVVLVVLGRGLPTRSFVSDRLPRVGSGRLYPVPILIAVVVIVALAATVLNANLIAGATVMAAVGIIGLSQVVVTGYAGQLSLAQMSMAGLGALAAGTASALLQVPFIVAILIAIVAVIPFGLLVGLPAVRTRGATLAIATLGFGVAVGALLLTNTNVNGGVMGLRVGAIDFFGISLDPYTAAVPYMTFAVLWLVLMGVLVTNLRRGRAGRRLLAVRTNERAASALGVNVGVAKLYAFTLAASIAAVGGVLLAYMNANVIVASGFDVLASITNLAFVVLGGIGYVGGALIAGSFNTGALPTTLISQWFGVFDVQSVLNVLLPLVGGLVLIVQIIAQPGGIVDAIVHGSAKSQRRRREARVRELARAEEQRAGGEKASREHVAALTRAIGVGASARAKDAARAAAEVAKARGLPRTGRGSTLNVEHVTVRYGSVTAVDDVSFEVIPGEILSIIGPNGAGKTSVMDAITGFAPMTGAVRLGAARIERWSAHRRARAGLVRSFQSLELLEDMSVLDNLRAASDAQDFASYLVDLVHPRRGGLTAATVAAIDAFELGDVLGTVPADLPYGDRHLVAIARAVAGNPSVLLLDEPAAGLSEAERERLSILIRRMADEWGLAIVLIEHDVELVRRVSDRLLALDFGRVIAAGTPDDVLADPRVVTAYLGEDAGLIEEVA